LDSQILHALETHFADFIEQTKMAEAGVSVCMRKDGEIVWQQQWGHKNAAGAPLDKDTMFGIASMSKGVTTTALALLEAEGKVSFYDRVDKYFPRLVVPGIPRESLLLHHLATHTSGISPLPLMAWSMAWHTPDDQWNQARNAERRAESQSKVSTLDDIIDYIAAGGYPILGQPGDVLSYCNDGFALLSAVVDQVSGMSLETFLRRRLFEPLGMERTILDIDGAEAMQMGNTTELFEQVDGKFVSTNTWDVAPPYRGTGWIKSTPQDMSRFYEMLCQGGMVDGKQIIPRRATEILFGDRFAASPQDSLYGYGLEKRPFKHHTIVEHAGGLTGVSSKGGFIKGSNGYSAVIFCNWEDGPVTALQNSMYNALLGYPLETQHFFWPIHEADVMPSGLATYTGRFRANEVYTPDVVITEEDGILHTIDSDSGKAYPLRYCGRTNFIDLRPGLTPDRSSKYVFRMDAETKRMEQVRYGNRTYVRVE
jgi:CubicO group peptidase (beta-lactamase class C family)